MPVLFDPSELRRFRDVVTRRLGLVLEAGKLDTLAEVLTDRMEACALTHLAGYEARLDGAELGLLADRLTVTETYFFRYWDQLRALSEVAMPDRARAAGARRLRILSAGCASGEEAYSLFILGRAALGGIAPQVHGIDISPRMIAKAARARYSAWSLRETPADLRERYFRTENRELCLDSEVTRRVTFETRNLVDDDLSFWREGAFDIVFCRNVLMYFSRQVMSDIIARISRSLTPGGYLFVGHAETLRGLTDDFTLRNTHDTFYYQKNAARPSSYSEVREVVPARGASEPTLPEPPTVDDASWVDAIQQASARVLQLAARQTARDESRGTALASGPAPADLTRAIDLLQRERFEEAVAFLESLPASSRNDPEAELLRAAILTNSGKLSDAEAICSRILARDAPSAGAHYLMALCREHAGDHGAAVDHDRRAIHLDGDFAMPHLHLGLLARRSSDRTRARVALARALTLLSREDPSRLLLFGGGFSREALVALCRSELHASEAGR